MARNENDSCFAVNEKGQTMHDLLMLSILGIEKIPEGFHVVCLDGNYMNCRRSNLAVVPETWIPTVVLE